jgi:hypothetical protein
VCGTKNTEEKSTWKNIGGPLKGSYAVISAKNDYNEFVSDFGMRVADPCKAHDDSKNIDLTPESTTIKDLKFHEGTDSKLWLRHEC